MMLLNLGIYASPFPANPGLERDHEPITAEYSIQCKANIPIPRSYKNCVRSYRR